MYEDLINKLRELPHLLFVQLGKHKDVVYQAADAIEELQKDLERSKDFEAFWKKEAEETLRNFQVAIAPKPQWIPVTESEPEQGKRYLVIRYNCVTKTPFIDILWHDAHDLWWNRLYKGKYNVTHWMPLPELPTD